MSYSFSVRAATKAEVLTKVNAELDKVVAAQPVHAGDRQQAYAATEAFLEIIPESDDMDLSVSVHGSLGWTEDGADKVFSSASVGVSAQLVVKEAAAA